MTNTTNNPNTVTIGKTTYKITSAFKSPLEDIIDIQGYVEGPRGAVKNIICFSNGATRIVHYSRGCMPRRSDDLWGDAATEIRQQMFAHLNQ